MILKGRIIETVIDSTYLEQTIKINKENQKNRNKKESQTNLAGFGQSKLVLKNQEIQQTL